MDMSFIQEHFVPVVVVGCLCVGYLIKKWVKDVDNKWIPTILALIGATMNCYVNGGIMIENIVYGAVTGLASTGLHQLFKNFVEGERYDG